MGDKTVEELTREVYELREFIYDLKMRFIFNRHHRYSGQLVEDEISRLEIEFERRRIAAKSYTTVS